MARRTGFPKVTRIPDDDLIVVGGQGTLTPRAATGVGLMTVRRPATIVDVYERGPDEPPRAIRVRDEVKGRTLFLVCTNRVQPGADGPRYWACRTRERYLDSETGEYIGDITAWWFDTTKAVHRE